MNNITLTPSDVLGFSQTTLERSDLRELHRIDAEMVDYGSDETEAAEARALPPALKPGDDPWKMEPGLSKDRAIWKELGYDK